MQPMGSAEKECSNGKEKSMQSGAGRECKRPTRFALIFIAGARAQPLAILHSIIHLLFTTGYGKTPHQERRICMSIKMLFEEESIPEDPVESVPMVWHIGNARVV